MATTATFAAANQPRSVADVSTIEVYQAYGTFAASAGSPVHFTNLKIPHRATITEIIASMSGDATLNASMAIGLAGGISSAALFGSESYSANATISSFLMSATGRNLPYKVSISDDQATRYVYPTVTVVAASDSTSLSVGLLVRYTMNKTNAPAQ